MLDDVSRLDNIGHAARASKMPPRSLLDLPTEVLARIPIHLDSLHSYLAFSSTCHYVHNAIATLPPPDLLTLTYATAPWSSEPLYLLTLLGRGIATYTASSPNRRIAAKGAIWEGAPAFLQWAVSQPGIAIAANFSITALRQLVEDKPTLWDVLGDLVDRNVGDQWYNIPDFWDGGRSDAYTIAGAACAEIPLQLALWGELFGGAFEEWLEAAASANGSPAAAATSSSTAAIAGVPASTRWDPRYPPPPPWAAPGLRTDFLKYTFLGWHVSLNIRRPEQAHFDRAWTSPYPASPSDFFVRGDLTPFHHPLRETQAAVGPYAEHREDQRQGDDHYTLRCLLDGSQLWGRVTKRVRDRCGGDFEQVTQRFHDPPEGEEAWKQKLWENCIYALGIMGMRMVRDTWESMRDDEDERERKRQLIMQMPRNERPPEWREGFYRLNPPGKPFEEQGEGWAKMRKWRGIIAGLKVPPREIVLRDGRPYAMAIGYGYPSLLGDLELILA